MDGMKKKRLTAVEWLFDQYKLVGMLTTAQVEKAKAMEKEQMMQLWKDFIDWSTEIDPSIYDSFKEAINDYFNETYTP